MEYPRRNILTIALLVEGIALALAIILARYFSIDLLPLSGNYIRDSLIGAAGALFPFCFFVYLMSENTKDISWLRSIRRIVTNDIKAIFSNAELIDIIIIALIAGVAEEMLFRGVLQVRFGIVAASIVFGLLHYISPAYVIIAALMGLYMGAFYYFSNSLLVPIQIHFLYDLAALIYLKYFVADKKQDMEERGT
ncbi:MAG: CPBP family intramembrane glutamic endopeptidase [Nitrospirota bacterium]